METIIYYFMTHKPTILPVLLRLFADQVSATASVAIERFVQALGPPNAYSGFRGSKILCPSGPSGTRENKRRIDYDITAYC